MEEKSVAGIDVGGYRKGLHAVVLRGDVLLDHQVFRGKSAVADCVAFCVRFKASAIAIDAPCCWSKEGGSRRAERELKIAGKQIQCFKTPTHARANNNPSGFYDWVVHGLEIYAALADKGYTLCDGSTRSRKVVLETFPHAVVCMLTGKLVRAYPKGVTRRAALRREHIDESRLANIDFVDAALCALTAQNFLRRNVEFFGDKDEGFIVCPKTGAR